MNGNVHVWIVEDALRFVLAKGTEREKQAFQAWESAYGGGDLKNTPISQSRIVDIIGVESKYTDYYHDLAIYLESVAGFWTDNITEYEGHIFTALNHFLSVPWYPLNWWRHDGYRYINSSRTGNDSRAMTGKVDTKDAEVDNDHSPVVDACRFGWTGSENKWKRNWEVDIRSTDFIPLNVFAYNYYDRLLFKYFTHVDVNGKRFDRINGMFLLGPVAHALADACVPQHTISAMGFKHQEWENDIETMVWGYELEDFDQVRDLLENHMKHYVYTDGPLKDMLAVDYMVSELCGWTTFTKFLELNGQNGIANIKNDTFWDNYIANQKKVKSDAKFFYNLAIAATVRLITESCYDVIKTGGGTNSTPVIRGINSYKLFGGLTERKTKVTKPKLHDISTKSLLGFKPTDSKEVNKTLLSTKENLVRWNNAKVSDKEINLCLVELEKEFLEQLIIARASGMKKFEPPEILQLPKYLSKLRNDCGLPDISRNLDTHPLFGLATFRPPTVEELADDSKHKKYLEASESNILNAKLLALTRCLAYNKMFLKEAKSRIQIRKIQSEIESIGKLVKVIIKSKKIPIEKLPLGQIDLKPISLTEVRPIGNVMEVK